MFYPLKFLPIYKNYLWGGRNLLKFGKDLPEGIVAESWEVSCHPEGESIIKNGIFKDMSLSKFIEKFQHKAMGTNIAWKPGEKFPLLVKFIDAKDKLSIQVHPDDKYAKLYESDKCGKNEMWYIIWAKPGAKLVYGLKPDIIEENLIEALKSGSIEDYLNYSEVFKGDIFDIPAGTVHAIGEGILLVEIQQNSNNTYRIYDYNRIDKNGEKRPLHLNKALDVINFSNPSRHEGVGKMLTQSNDRYKIYKLVKNENFLGELYCINKSIEELADGSKFYIYIFIEGDAFVYYDPKDSSKNVDINKVCFRKNMSVKAGDTIFIPASMGKYKISGNTKAIKTYVPDKVQI
jgi:mannose-6-phosphate isomerase